MINSERLKWGNNQTQFPGYVINQSKSSVRLLLLKRVYLYWKYEFSRRCCMYFIKTIHSPVETFLDFRFNNPKLRTILEKVYFGKFGKQESFLKLLRKICKNNLSKNSLFFSRYKLSVYNFTKKKTLLWVYNKDAIKILKPSLLSASW